MAKRSERIWVTDGGITMKGNQRVKYVVSLYVLGDFQKFFYYTEDEEFEAIACIKNLAYRNKDEYLDIFRVYYDPDRVDMVTVKKHLIDTGRL